jgi:hypothetical protein
VAQTTVTAIGYLQHGIFYRALFGTRKYVGMTNLAAVPHDVFFVGKDDVGHPNALRGNGKVLLYS